MNRWIQRRWKSSFRSTWWITNALLFLALVATAGTAVWEYSTRQYLRGFSDAIIPEATGPVERVQAILSWMQNGPPRLDASGLSNLSNRDPRDTLNYRQLMAMCGSATNAFLNLATSAGLESRRLLLLSPNRQAKHVVAEVLLNGQWIVVDPAYRVIMRDSSGKMLTRRDLQNSATFAEASAQIPGYPKEYNYDSFAHVRISALPFRGFQFRKILDGWFPGWDEYVNWSLLLERRSFLYLFLSINFLLILMVVRVFLAWLADNHLRVPRFRLRENLGRATAAFFTSPEIK